MYLSDLGTLAMYWLLAAALVYAAVTHAEPEPKKMDDISYCFTVTDEDTNTGFYYPCNDIEKDRKA